MTLGGLIALVIVFALVTGGLTFYLQGEWSWWKSLGYVLMVYAILILLCASVLALGLFLMSLDQPL